MKKIWIVGAIAVMAEVIREISSFRIRRYYVCSEKLTGEDIKLVFLTDLHNQSYGKNNEKLIRAVQKERPSLILVGGDMLLNTASKKRPGAVALYKALSEIAPVYAADGNHEQKLLKKPKGRKFYDALQSYMKRLGIEVLHNETTSFAVHRDKLLISGLDIPKECYKRKNGQPFTSRDYEACLGAPKEEGYHILMAHNPAFMATYLAGGADLILSGHLHGGVARIPFFRGVISPQLKCFPYYSGEMRKEGNQTVIVSRGLGIHTIPVRFLNEAELVVIHLSGKQA